MAGLYIFLLGLVLPQFLMAFARREQCVHPGYPAAMRRMRALRGEGLAGGWGLMPAGGSVCPSRVLGAASLTPLILLPGTSERALAPSSPCPLWGSWGPLRGDLARLALVGAAEPQSPSLSSQSPCPSPAQLRLPALNSLQCIAAILSLGTPEWAQSPKVVFPLPQ